VIGTQGGAQACPAGWRTNSPPANTLHVVTKDMTIRLNNSDIHVRAGALVHLRRARRSGLRTGGEDGLRPAYRADRDLIDSHE